MLDDPPRVADRLAIEHEDGHAVLIGESHHLVAERAARGHPDLLEGDLLALEGARDPAARA
jgi:hypothetical protein